MCAMAITVIFIFINIVIFSCVSSQVIAPPPSLARSSKSCLYQSECIISQIKFRLNLVVVGHSEECL